MLSRLYLNLHLDWEEFCAAQDMLYELWAEEDAARPTAVSTHMLLGGWTVMHILEGGCASPQEFMKKVRRVMLRQSDLGEVDPATGELIETETEEKEG